MAGVSVDAVIRIIQALEQANYRELMQAVHKINLGEYTKDDILDLISSLCWYYDTTPQQWWTESLHSACRLINVDYDTIIQALSRRPAVRKGIHLYRRLVDEGKLKPIDILSQAEEIYYA